MKFNLTITTVLVLILGLCSFCGSHPKGELTNDISGKYVDNSGSLSIDIKPKGDSLLGRHCFVVQEGNRIDCCLEENGFSLKLRHESKNIYDGIMISCYDDQVREIMVVGSKDSVKFILKMTHPFIPDTIRFYKRIDK